MTTSRPSGTVVDNFACENPPQLHHRTVVNWLPSDEAVHYTGNLSLSAVRELWGVN